VAFHPVAFRQFSGEIFQPLRAPAFVVAPAQVFPNLGEGEVGGRLLPCIGRDEESVGVFDQRRRVARGLQPDNLGANLVRKRLVWALNGPPVGNLASLPGGIVAMASKSSGP